MTDEIILHHYPASPFSEKVRLVLGAKGLAWRSVKIPEVMPKPDVVALTGGYRRTPVLQIGADVYCDSALICKVIDAIAPQPPLYAADVAGTSQMLAQWADSVLFWTCIGYTLQPAGIASVMSHAPGVPIAAFAADRATFSARMPRQTVADATAALQSYLGWLEAHIADGRGFLVRGQLSIADFAVAHCLWFVKLAPPLAGILDGFPRLLAWLECVRAFGHGRPETMPSELAVAKAAERASHEPVNVDTGLGFERGARVTVAATDYGTDPVEGVLVGLTRDRVTVERTDPRAGTVHVHFPRLGFQIKAVKAEAA